MHRQRPLLLAAVGLALGVVALSLPWATVHEEGERCYDVDACVTGTWWIGSIGAWGYTGTDWCSAQPLPPHTFTVCGDAVRHDPWTRLIDRPGSLPLVLGLASSLPAWALAGPLLASIRLRQVGPVLVWASAAAGSAAVAGSTMASWGVTRLVAHADRHDAMHIFHEWGLGWRTQWVLGLTQIFLAVAGRRMSMARVA